LTETSSKSIFLTNIGSLLLVSYENYHSRVVVNPKSLCFLTQTKEDLMAGKKDKSIAEGRCPPGSGQQGLSSISEGRCPPGSGQQGLSSISEGRCPPGHDPLGLVAGRCPPARQADLAAGRCPPTRQPDIAAGRCPPTKPEIAAGRCPPSGEVGLEQFDSGRCPGS
jgi:hypothetical protein